VLVQKYMGHYGVQSDFRFNVLVPSGTNSNRFFNAAVPWVAGDVQISKDGGVPTNVASLPVRIGTSSLFQITLQAAEMTAADIKVLLVDQDGPAWRDTQLEVMTIVKLGQVHIRADLMAAATPAMILRAAATGYSVELQDSVASLGFGRGVWRQTFPQALIAQAGGASSITLSASAVATDNYYNGMVVMLVDGPGVGQSRLITSYVGATRVATLNRSWSVNPTATTYYVLTGSSETLGETRGELTAMPVDGASYGDKIQLIYQRFAFKITQTATVQTLFRADNTTVLATRSVSDSGGTQTIGKLS
jgi:hypothetical protein